MTDLSISPQERALLAQKNLEKFWLSRLRKQDPIARIGYGLWCKSADDLKREIILGDAEYWAHKGFPYWEFMARSTVVNISVGPQKAGFKGTVAEMRMKVREVGLEVAWHHAMSVERDYKKKLGTEPGLLSKKQISKYHHIAFSLFGIPPDSYGGTWFGAVPDNWELELYGNLYCHDCDTSD
ncbi:hypothetical protein [Marinobacter sp.]|uniref:hypothetical protein n=1 Tax=Marinobacter sp. TaxID=50741 RepID=UPI003A91E164